MGQITSLYGAKIHPSTRTNEKETARASSDYRLLAQFNGEELRAPVHEDFNSFLASSTSHIQEKISDATKMAAAMQNHRFSPEDESSTRNQLRTTPEIKLEPTLKSSMSNRAPETPRLLEILQSAPSVQPQKYTMDKGYGSRMATDPLIILACATDVDKISMGLVSAINGHSKHQHTEDDSHSFNESNQKSKASLKASTVDRSEHASLLRREEIEVLRDVREKFQQQLNTQYPHITVPLKHPEGIVDIHMRFERKTLGEDETKGAVRVMFSGSNTQIVALFAQHREEFMNIILKNGYTIDSSRMQFNGPSLTKSLQM